MVGRVKDFFSKLLFCIKVSGSTKTFFTLILNSKRFSNFYNNQKHINHRQSELPVHYLLKFSDQRRNVFLRTYSGDIAIFYEILWRGVYNVSYLNWKDFKCVIDIGANVGVTALFFRTMAPKAIIIAIEPDPDNFSILHKNVKFEIYSKKISAIHAAAAHTDSILCFEKSQFAYNTKMIEDNNGTLVRSISLNSLINDYSINKIDLVKVDIEGFEHQLFARNTEWLNLVQNIIIEIHSLKDFDVFSNQVSQLGFSIKKLSGDIQPEGIYLASRDFSFNKQSGHGNLFHL